MRKLLLIILILLLVTSCTKKSDKKQENIKDNEYLTLIKQYKVREKNINNTVDNAAFDEFLDKIFVETMELDYLSMHYTVIDYKSLGIEKPSVDIGELKYGYDEENIKNNEDQLKQLQSFDFDSLSYRQQYDYEALEYSLYETLASLMYYQYDFLFSSASNLPENLISNFTDFTFYDEESIEDYLLLLADIDRYFDDALKYTKDQSDDGYGMIDVWIDYTKDVCNGAVNKTDNNTLIVTFDDRIDKLDFIDETKKQEYKQKNKQIVLDEVLPSFSKISKEIEQYRGKEKMDDYVLKNLDPNYAELVYILRCSNNAKMEETFENLKKYITDLETIYVNNFYDPEGYEEYSKALNGEINALNLVDRQCLDYLRDNMDDYYTNLGAVEYDVQELDPDTAPATTVAYYWPSPIDNHNQNIIRTNPNNMVAGYDTFSTLSHEGFPGHLYQHVYYRQSNPHNFRSVISFVGYTEGWAVDAQKYAYRYSGIKNQGAQDAMYFDSTYYFPLYSLIDMGVNYFGWNNKDIINYFDDNSMLFSFDNDTAENIRNILIEMPGIYCSYGLGSLNFYDLEQYARNSLGDKFNIVEYHDAILKNGPLPFNILKTAVDEYIEANK